MKHPKLAAMQLKSNKHLNIIDKCHSKFLFKRERERNRRLTLHSRRGAESGKQQPRSKPWMQKVDNLKPILKIRRKILINSPQHRDSRIIILRLHSTMNIQNTERTFRQFRAQLEANIPLQPLPTDNRSCSSITKQNKKSRIARNHRGEWHIEYLGRTCRRCGGCDCRICRIPQRGGPGGRQDRRNPRQGNRARPHRRRARTERGGSGRRRLGRRRGPALRSLRSSSAPSSATTLWIPPYRCERWRVYWIPPAREEDRTVTCFERTRVGPYGLYCLYGHMDWEPIQHAAFGPKIY